MTPKHTIWMNCTNCGFEGYMPDKSTCPTCRSPLEHRLPDKDQMDNLAHEFVEASGDWQQGKTSRMDEAVRNLNAQRKQVSEGAKTPDPILVNEKPLRTKDEWISAMAQDGAATKLTGVMIKEGYDVIDVAWISDNRSEAQKARPRRSFYKNALMRDGWEVELETITGFGKNPITRVYQLKAWRKANVNKQENESVTCNSEDN